MTNKKNREVHLSTAIIEQYIKWLKENERAASTVDKYRQILLDCENWFNGKSALTKDKLMEYKCWLISRYAPTTVNVCICAMNGLLRFIGKEHLCLKKLRIEEIPYRLQTNELTKEDYVKMIECSCTYKQRCLVETMVKLGLRVSEVKYITVESLKRGYTLIDNKGKSRYILLPESLCKLLLDYVSNTGINTGAVFVTCHGTPLSRQQIWKIFKELARKSGVDERKAYPHNARHLFAVVFMRTHHDIDLLAKIMGHSSINTTLQYTKIGANEMRNRMEMLQFAPDMHDKLNMMRNMT